MTVDVAKAVMGQAFSFDASSFLDAALAAKENTLTFDVQYNGYERYAPYNQEVHFGNFTLSSERPPVVAAVPEPSTYLVLVVGLGALWLARFKAAERAKS